MPLDAATTELLAELARSTDPPLTELTPAQGRSLEMAELPGVAPQVASSDDVTIEGPNGDDLTVRILTPIEQGRGVIVYLHGGGWVLGSVNEYDAVCRELANRSGCTVVVVDYRLAPESPFPAAVEDCWTALKWVSDNLPRLAPVDSPIFVAGDSAGGNLAAVMAQLAAQTGEVALAAQVLIYPMIDTDLNTASHLDPENQCLLTRDIIEWFWDHYAPEPEQRADPRSRPLLGTLSSELAPAIVLSCRYDVLLDEVNAYADRLEEAGVPVVRHHFDDQMHGFFTLVGVLPGALNAVRFIAEQLRTQLAQ